jgi:glycosyltransferase involved in cell wall biosynthesis
MRIALITRSHVDDGGVSVHVRRSAAALRVRGHETVVVSGTLGEGDDVVTFESLAGGSLEPKRHKELVGVLRNRGIEVAHFHYVDDPALIRAVGTTARTLVSSHGWAGCAPNTRYFRGGKECFRAHGPGCMANMLVRNCKHMLNPAPAFKFYAEAADRLEALRSADVAVAHSTAVASHLKHNEIPNVHLVALPIEAPEVSPGPPAGPPLVAYVGRLVAAKGVDVLLKAAKNFDAPVEIAGEGWMRERLERTARRLGISDRVVFRGWIAPGETDDLYRRAHVVAVPSRWPEPFGMTGAEALAWTRPVVASRTGGTGDWLRDGESGFAVDPVDPDQLGAALGRLLADRAAAQAMGEAGRAYVLEHFNAERHVEDLMKAYVGASVA